MSQSGNSGNKTEDDGHGSSSEEYADKQGQDKGTKPVVLVKLKPTSFEFKVGGDEPGGSSRKYSNDRRKLEKKTKVI